MGLRISYITCYRITRRPRKEEKKRIANFSLARIIDIARHKQTLPNIVSPVKELCPIRLPKTMQNLNQTKTSNDNLENPYNPFQPLRPQH